MMAGVSRKSFLSIDTGEEAATCIANCVPNSKISFFGFVVAKLNRTPNLPTFFFYR